jgi:type VI secretion system FHA domain protein
MIKFSGGAFYIEDRNSSNGIFINSPANRLTPGEAHPLRNGDWLLIEPYEIRVSLDQAATAAPSDPFAFNSPAPAPSAQRDPFAGGFGAPVPVQANPAGFGPLEPVPDENLDPLVGLFGPQASPPPPPGPKAADLPGLPPWVDPYQPSPVNAPAPPEPVRAAPILPDNWDESGAIEIKPAAKPPQPEPHPARREPPLASAPAPAPVPAAPASGGDRVDLAAMIAAAGLGQATASPEFARDFGTILRIVVEGLMDVLRARRDFKNEFRLGMTTLRPAENNPLKFSANVEDALHNLLVKRNPAYLGAVEAFEDAFDDVRNDQMAMLAGMRAAFEMMLQEFDPDRLQQVFDQGARSAIIATPAKMRYWDQYREKFRDMVRDSEKCFRDLFGDEFAAAYEEHLQQLKSRGRR